ncbi:MAG TPA: serine hydrolase [Rariglobus sp.]
MTCFRFALTALALATPCLDAATHVTSNGVTWTFADDHKTGVFVNGDPWVIGPVVVTSITNSLNDPGFTPRPGQNGSMINPGVDTRHGYESALHNYDASLNAGLPNGNPLSASNPIKLSPGSTLVSAVSWLYHSETNKEPGCPDFYGKTNAPRPALRSVGILTIVDAAPPADAFRPAYSAPDKSIRFLASQIDYSRLPVLALPAGADAPSFASLADAFSKTWLDHVYGWIGGQTHPSEHMPDYGRHMGRLVGDATLRLFTDGVPRGQNPDKDRLLIGLIQYGIDSTGIADAGGGWPADGGIGLGRKWPVLFAGALLGDSHMLDVGQWKTRFQEDEQTFYVTQAEVDITNGSNWKPDKRAARQPYTKADIGTPEWGIHHAKDPRLDNAHSSATYREATNATVPAFALAAHLMHLKKAWNHPAFFDYSDRAMAGERAKVARPSAFLEAMWTAYRPSAAPKIAFPASAWTPPPAGAPVIPAAKVTEAVSVIERVVGADGVSGTIVVQNGYILWSGDHVNEVRPVWSCTKSFLSTCLGLLWDDGKLSPDDLASKHLPDLAKDYPTVTLRHLATFTSGVHINDGTLDAGPPDYSPGAAMHYSAQADLLALALTRIAGEPLRDLFKRRIADPVGMDPAGWVWKDFGEHDSLIVNGGAGRPERGLHMTAQNLARFGWLYANDGVWNGRRLISQRYITEATVPQVDARIPLHDPKGWYHVLPGRYGLNWWTNGIGADDKRLWPSAPASAFAAQGNKNNICIIVPEWKLVLVRTGQDKIIDVGLYDEALRILGENLPTQNSASVPTRFPHDTATTPLIVR